MGKKDVPAFKKKTPTNYGPELLDIWKRRYGELIEHHPKYRCLEIIGEEYQVNRTAVEYHLFPSRKAQQKKCHARSWSHEKADPEIHKKRIDYKREYMNLRYHIDEFIEQAYQCTPLDGSMTLEELSRNIELESGISLAPKTILGLNERYEKKHGLSLIVPVSGSDTYRLYL